MSAFTKQDQDIIRRFGWTIASIGVHFEDLRHVWARLLGVSGSQWMIIVALADLDHGEGAPVKTVAKMLHVDASFVTTQSKLLEKKGFLRRKTSSKDARIVNMSLTDKTYKHLAELASHRGNLNEFVFEEFKPHEVEELTEKLAALQMRLEKAALKAAVDFQDPSAHLSAASIR
jgi:DNA-binding MarR family transcriptional regulator